MSQKTGQPDEDLTRETTEQNAEPSAKTSSELSTELSTEPPAVPPESSPGQSNESSNEDFAEPTPTQRRRTLRNLFLSFCLFALIAFAVLSWYVTTDTFQQIVRRRVVSSIEKIVGGQVELGELHTIPFRLRVDARNLTIHGHEASGQPPFLHVDRLQAEIKIISILSKTIGLHSLVLEHPVVHIVTHPDGSTNVPVPQVTLSPGQGPLDELISLSVSHIEVQRGEAQWQDQKFPFDFSARDLALLAHYSLLRRRYEAHLTVGSVLTQFEHYPSFQWQADASLILSLGRAEISSLTLASGKSNFHFTGHILDFHNPRLSGDYRATIDLAELATLLRQPQLREGTVQLAGKGEWDLQNFSAQGTILAQELGWSQTAVPSSRRPSRGSHVPATNPTYDVSNAAQDGRPRLALRNGRLTATYSVSPARFHLSAIKASLLGGELQGDADIINWQSSLTASPPPARRHLLGRIPPGGLQRGSIRLQVSTFPLQPALEFISSAQLPLDQLNLAANGSGAVDLLWVGSIHDAETRLNLDLTPADKFAPGELPVRGRADGVYRGSRDELEVTSLHLVTSGSEVIAAGTLAENASLRFSLTSHNLREWKPLLDAAYGSRPLPLLVHGWTSLAGNATGKLSAISFTGNLELYDFDTTLPPTDRLPPRPVHWDALNTAIQYSADHFALRNGSLIHGHTTAHFDASVALDRRAENLFPQNAPFTLHLDLRNAAVAEAAQLAGLDQPLAGSVNLIATLSGTRASPHGDGHFEIHNASAFGLAFPVLRGDLRLSQGELQFNNIEANAYGSALSGSASINIENLDQPNAHLWDNQFRLHLTGQNLALSRLPRMQSTQFAADGVADFNLSASGTRQQPIIAAHFHLKDLAFDHEPAGDFYLDATTVEHQLDLKAHSDFEKSDLTIGGKVGLERDFPADLNLAFHHLDADALLRIYLAGKITGHALLDGTLQLRGPLRIPRNLKAAAELQSLNADFGHVRVQSVEPIRFEVADESLLIESLHLAGSGTDFTAHGRAHLSGARDLDMRLDGTINMALWQSFNPKIQSRGTLGVNLTAEGPMAHPIMQGRLEVKNTFLSHNDFPSGLSDLNGTLLFDRNRVQIENLTGTTGGGTIALTGSAAYQSGLFQLDFGATAHDVRLRYPPGVSSTANADLRLTGTTNAALLSGSVLVTKLAVTPGFDFGAYIERSRQTVVLAQADSLQSHLKLDVHVVTTPELQMQTAVARLSGNADLRVRGTAERPAILGRVEVLEGEVTFNGTKYKLERGDVTFANPAKTQPIIDLQATTRVRDYDITVQFRGDASVANGLKVTWQSEPQLPEADVIALLALGRTQEESAAVANTGGFGFGGDASNLLINQALNSTVNSRLQRLFGVSRVKIDPQGLPSETAVVRGPQVTIEQQVANNLTLTYSTNVEVSNQQVIQVEYNITRNVSIVALRDWNGVVSFDFKIRRRKK